MEKRRREKTINRHIYFSRIKHIADILQKVFLLNLRVAEKESRMQLGSSDFF